MRKNIDRFDYVNITKGTIDVVHEIGKDDAELANATYDDFENNIVSYAMTVAAEMFENGIYTECVRVCTLDEEYIEWLNDIGLKHNEENAGQYISAMSDEDALRLLRKNEFDNEYTACVIPLVLDADMYLNQKTNFKLDELSVKLLQRYLDRIYGKGTVYVPGYILSCENVFDPDTPERLIDFAKEYEESGMQIRYDEWNYQDNYIDVIDIADDVDGRQLIVLIPFVVHAKIDTPYIDIANVSLAESPQMLYSFTKSDMYDCGIDNVPDIWDTRFFEHLAENINFTRLIARPIEIYSMIASAEPINT